MKKEAYAMYRDILREELLLAMGCTEPVAVAYAGAIARSVLDKPQSIRKCELYVSGNIIKNVKSVIVPNTDGMKGLETAVILGVIAGDETAGLQVISNVTALQREKTKQALRSCPVEVHTAPNDKVFYIEVCLTADGETSCTVIEDFHTHITRVEHNGVQQPLPHCGEAAQEAVETDRSHMTVEGILEYAETVDLEEVRFLLERQIQCNTAISAEGLKSGWGADIGNVLLDTYGNDVRVRARARAAAGSDARMSGCEMPVVINSGSGNQGLTVSLPVLEYAREYGKSQEDVYRALAVANLCAIHQKTAIGKLSAYCGAVTAGSGAGAGIAYLLTGDYKTVAHTIVNALAIVSGIVCDGAKPSCAAKIASAVDAGILGFEMYRKGHQFYGGDGILSKGIENTIRNVGELGRDGMRETDRKILQIMTRN